MHVNIGIVKRDSPVSPGDTRYLQLTVARVGCHDDK